VGFQGRGAHIEIGVETAGADAFLLADDAIWEKK
jgi:hypothetical protein